MRRESARVVKAILKLKAGRRTKKYVVKRRFYEEKDFKKFLTTGRANYWRVSATQMRSILKLTSPQDWLYRYVDRDPGLGGDRSDPDFRPMDGYVWNTVLEFIGGPMDGWKGINLVNGHAGSRCNGSAAADSELVFDIWYIKWSHLLKPARVEMELEVPLNAVKAGLLAELL